MMEVRISRILAPACGYQPHHRHFKERHSYTYHYLPTPSFFFFPIFLWFPVISHDCDRCLFCPCDTLFSFSSSVFSEDSPMISSKVKALFRLFCDLCCLLKNVAIRNFCFGALRVRLVLILDIVVTLLSLSGSSAWSGSSSLRMSCCHSSHASFPSVSSVARSAVPVPEPLRFRPYAPILMHPPAIRIKFRPVLAIHKGIQRAISRVLLIGTSSSDGGQHL